MQRPWMPRVEYRGVMGVLTGEQFEAVKQAHQLNQSQLRLKHLSPSARQRLRMSVALVDVIRRMCVVIHANHRTMARRKWVYAIKAPAAFTPKNFEWMCWEDEDQARDWLAYLMAERRFGKENGEAVGAMPRAFKAMLIPTREVTEWKPTRRK
jgi:hypothetical protein